MDVWNVGLVWLRSPKGFLPSSGAFEVYLSERGLGGHWCVGNTMFARILMVVLVNLEHTFEFFQSGSFSLSKDGLFYFDKGIRAAQAIVDTLNSWSMNVDT